MTSVSAPASEVRPASSTNCWRLEWPEQSERGKSQERLLSALTGPRVRAYTVRLWLVSLESLEEFEQQSDRNYCASPYLRSFLLLYRERINERQRLKQGN